MAPVKKRGLNKVSWCAATEGLALAAYTKKHVDNLCSPWHCAVPLAHLFSSNKSHMRDIRSAPAATKAHTAGFLRRAKKRQSLFASHKHNSHGQMYHGKGSQSSLLFAKDGRGSMGLTETPEGPVVGIMTKPVAATHRLDSDDPALESVTDVGAVHAVSCLSTTDTTATSVLDDMLGHIEEGAKASQMVLCICRQWWPNKEACCALVTALDAPCTACPLKTALVDLMLCKGDAALDKCMAVVSRIESLVHLCAATATAEDPFAGEMLGRVTTWLLKVVQGEAEPARAGDPWMPMADVGYVAGRVCSAPLLECVYLTVERRPVAQIDTIEAPQPTKSTPTAPWYHAIQIACIIESFVLGLIDADQTQCTRERTEACRGPTLGLVRALRPKIGQSHRYVDVDAPARDRINRSRAVLADVVDRSHGYRRDALVHVLALLASIDRHYACTDDTATLKIIDTLDLVDPSHSAAFAGLDIIGADIANGGNNDGVSGDSDNVQHEPPHDQDDLLTAVSAHHTDLFLAILVHLDAWDIGSLALASRSHYARIIDAIKEDDIKGDSRQLNGVALSGTVWLQRHGYAGGYDPTPKVIVPTLDRGILPGLGPLLLLCRSMPTVEATDPTKRRLALLATLPKACVLDCGGAIVRCLDGLDIGLQPGVCKRYQRPAKLVTSLAIRAGSHASPTLMRIACTASLLWMRQSGRRIASYRHCARVGMLMEKVVAGIDRWLQVSCLPHHGQRFGDLPGLVKFLCKFLRALRPDIRECGRQDERTIAVLRATFRREGMALLAPGHGRPMPAQRVALALTLFDAVRLPPSD